ncbi:MAG: geranylgeranylglyceryl/heptaprenylglyceryl phosphate synthase [Paludibacteraceae bacterium]
MKNNYRTIIENAKLGKKMIAVLLDPDKCVGTVFDKIQMLLDKNHPDFIFIGGSKTINSTNDLILALQHIPVPKILFPGDASQFSPAADAVLFLSLISGRNTDYLIGQHVSSAKNIKKSAVEVIPTGYILIDGGVDTAVKRISNTTPIAADDIETCISTALAGELLGLQLTYLEAGSGAANPVSAKMIAATKYELSHPLIVGGGIKTEQHLKSAFSAGADLAVIGNLFETQPEKIVNFIQITRNR